MSISKLSFFIYEALTNIRRSPVISFITISTIATALLLTGASMLLTMNMENFLEHLKSDSLITVYLKQSAGKHEANALSLRLKNLEDVEDIKVITPEQSLAELFPEGNEHQFSASEISPQDNPLPYCLRIIISSQAQLESILTNLASEPLIDSYTYGKEFFDKIERLSRLISFASIAIASLLALASLFIIYNTIRLTLFMRKEEILIMKLVGATNSFVRGPFITEAFIEGTLAATLAIFLLFVLYGISAEKIQPLIPFFNISMPMQVLVKLAIKMLLMGIMLGVAGSMMSLRDINKFNKATLEGV
ncbi:MAG: ABC transporter permease [Candidatus Riflebacteria bacterium]|nr:ABC transporter permease [Candidatus Riflebacteria bacterium]